MKVVLTSQIRVERISVFAEMAWMERRPELGLLCRAAREHGNRISAPTVQSALPGLSDAGAENVRAWCRMLGLCDGSGGLTALGEDVAESDEAPVPEQGVYGLWLAQHPVIGRRVLAVERLSASRDQRFEDIVPLPIDPERGKVFRSAVDPKERFQVRDLPSNHGGTGCVVVTTQATCNFRWTLDFDNEQNSWYLDGMIEAPQGKGKAVMQPLQHQAEEDDLDLWRLAEAWGMGPLSSFGRWQSAERRLAVPFNSVAENEIDTFRKTMTLGRVDVPGKGSYSNVMLEGVPVGPESPEDAQRWALRRLERHLEKQPTYRSRAEVRELFANLAEETPLAAFSPTLPSHDDLLRAAAMDPMRFWSLAAPVDLCPHALSSEVLGEFRVGQAASSTSVASNDVVRVPYRGGWSMGRLVDALLGGATPRRMLLCDRFVRGFGNHAALKLLVEAVRAVAPSVVVNIWTGDEEADFHQIETITGTAPLSYRKVFGKNFPHDRYFLVLPDHGKGFGWQMSNSPLHARSSDADANANTPLRWKDLVAHRLLDGEFEASLNNWFTGGVR